MIKKENVLRIIDSVMNNREIDSIRNAILAIRDKVVEMPDDEYTFHGSMMKKVCESCDRQGDNRQSCPFGWACESTFNWSAILSRLEDGEGCDMSLMLGCESNENETEEFPF